MAIIEEDFPRGGSRPSHSKTTPKQENLFSLKNDQKPKKKSRKRKNSDTEENVVSGDLSSKFVGNLSYSSVQGDMAILGNIRKIHNLTAEVELPGRIYGQLYITSISDAFTKVLQAHVATGSNENVQLSSILKAGQYLPVRILSATQDEEASHISLSTNPSFVNKDFSHQMFKKGMLVWASIAEQLQHGYSLDMGVPNVRSFLPNKNIDEGISYVIGQPLWCVVHTADITPSATTLRVSSRADHIHSATQDCEGLSLHSIVPGMQVEFEVTKKLKNGLEGKVADYKAYVNEAFLSKALQRPGDFKEEQVLNARVLYIQPVTKFIFLTLKPFETLEASLKMGQILPATIISETFGGIYIKLSKTAKGLVTYKRILKNHGKMNINKVKRKYAPGHSIHCRILDYNRMEDLYICTVEKALLQENIFAVEDLTVGQSVEATVVELNPSGIVVKCGNVTGFVENLHLSNSAYSETIKSKFRVKQKVKGRVLNISPTESVKVTLKPALVESDVCLAKIEDAVVGKQYPGVVVYSSKAGILVKFYGGVKGMIPMQLLKNYTDEDPSSLFFVGQVVVPTIRKVDVNNNKIMLSLVPTDCVSVTSRMLGQKLDAVVKKIENGLEVFIKKRRQTAFIPLNHLSINYDLNSLLLKTYKEGDKICKALCVKEDGKLPILSVRESIVGSKHNFTVPHFKMLKESQVLRCSFDSNSQNGIYVTTPIKGCRKGKFEIDRKDLPKQNFLQHESILAKITSINKENNDLELSSKLNDVFDYKAESGLLILEQYLTNVQRIKLHLTEEKDPIAQLELGQRFNCVIHKVGERGGCSVSLPNNVQGLVDIQHCPKDVKQGTTVEAVILWIDYAKKFVELSIKPDVIEKINEVQDGIVQKSFTCLDTAEILLIRDNFALGIIKTNNQLVFLPNKFHENDSRGLTEHYKNYVDKKAKIFLYRRAGGHLIGFLKALKLTWVKNAKRINRKSTDTVDTPKKRKIEDEHNQNSSKKNRTDSESSQSSSSSDYNKNSDKKAKNKKKIKENTKISNDVESSKSNKRKSDQNESDKKRIRKNSENSQNSNEPKKDSLKKQDVKKTNHLLFKNVETEPEIPLLPGISSFYSNNEVKEEEPSSSEDETEEDAKENQKKKKKLTPAERAEQARLEEERIAKIEKDLADFAGVPESAEHFDRVLTADPNNSTVWSQYAAFHLSNTEIDKARAVIKRALDSIQMDKVHDKLNVWITYLNMENMCGTKDSFEKVFEEAVRCNDDYAIYIETIKILAASNKFEEMEEKVKKFRGKFKNLAKTWIDLSRVYYSISKLKEARSLKEVALKSIQDKQEQMNIVVQFAISEFKNGEQSQGEALFETILDSYPARVDVWNSYVDQLVKKGSIDSARRVLERAVCQKLSMVKMRSLYKKFQQFEKVYGTPETLQNVKDSLLSYASSLQK